MIEPPLEVILSSTKILPDVAFATNDKLPAPLAVISPCKTMSLSAVRVSVLLFAPL